MELVGLKEKGMVGLAWVEGFGVGRGGVCVCVETLALWRSHKERVGSGAESVWRRVGSVRFHSVRRHDTAHL